MNEDWIFVPHKDSKEGDMFFSGVCDPSRAPKECMAVNTLGFYKNKIVFPLVTSPYFSDKDGIYIRRSAIPPELRAREFTIDPLTLNTYLIERHS